MAHLQVRRALVSVYDKTGLIPFAQRLAASGIEIVSSGGTATELTSAGITVTTVSDVTGAPEILAGRVKTLHPKIHGGILARVGDSADDLDLVESGIEPFQLVVANLYPFADTVADLSATEAEIIEKIDIGGPAMVRAAAKNHTHVGVVTSPDQYDMVADAIEGGGLSDELRKSLAREAFFLTGTYDAGIVGWMGDDRLIPLRVASRLRYGENPHQAAELLVEAGASPWWARSVVHQGKEMSFNNYSDTEAAWRLAVDLPSPASVVVKHNNPCGAATGSTVLESFEKAWAGDPLAAFGGVVAINGDVDAATAAAISQRFIEVVIARSVEDDALGLLASKKNLRVITAPTPGASDPDYRRLESGFLRQERDVVDYDDWEVASERRPGDAELSGLRLAWAIAAHAKSNAIVVVADGHAVGIGAGDQSRVGAAERAVVKAGDRAKGGVAASDAFFPFRDGLDALADAGVTAVVQPGGSVRDQDVIDAANEHGVAMVLTGRRHFRH